MKDENQPSTLLLIGMTAGCKPGSESQRELKEADTATTEAIDQSENTVTHQQQDTLNITDSELTVDPFGLGDNPLNSKGMLTKKTAP